MTVKRNSENFILREIDRLRICAIKHRRNVRAGKKRGGLRRYLTEVYRSYLNLRSNGIGESAKRRIEKLLQLPTNRSSHLLLILIWASAPKEDPRQKSRWSQALIFAYGWRQRPERLDYFFGINGGIYGCSRKQALLNASRPPKW